MPNRNFITWISTLALLGAVPRADALDLLPRPAFAKSMIFQGDLDYFSSEANYDGAGGSYSDLNPGSSYSNFGFRFTGRYFVKRTWEIGGRMNAAFAQSSNGTFERENSALTSFSGLTRYYIIKGQLLIIPEFELEYPITTISDNTDEVLTSESVISLRPGAWFNMRWSAFRPYLFLGLDYRMEGRAGLLPWRAGAEGRMGQLLWGAEVHGFKTLIEDEETDNSLVRERVTNRVSGGSLKYYAVNPEVMSLQIRGGWDYEGIKTLVGVDQSINGKNYAHGMTISLSLIWPLSGPPPKKPLSEMSSPPTEVTPNQPPDEFKVEGENYDHSLFEEPKPAPPPPPLKKRKPAKPKVDVDKMLNETEKSLER